jgi:RND family efflux transporter MFP subunit
MKRWLKWMVVGLVIVLLAGGVLRALSARKAQKEALAVQQEAQKVPAILELGVSDTVQAKTIELTQGLPLSGPLKAVNSGFVKARVAGELQALTVREGDFVKAGDVVARVDATEFQARVRQAQQQAESAKAQVDIARRSFDNNRSLVEQGFISKTALDSSMSTLASAEANFRAAQAGADVAQKALDDTVLRAPVSGQVAQRLAQPGERVAIDARIVEVVDISRLEVEASLSAADSMQVKVGQSAEFTIEGAGKTLAAKVARVNPSAVAGSRAVLVYFSVEPYSGLRQGLFAQGTLQTGVAKVLALPLEAVRTDKPQPYVQLVSNGEVQHQTVTLGVRGNLADQVMVEVKGIAEGSTVLNATIGIVRSGTPVKVAGTK